MRVTGISYFLFYFFTYFHSSSLSLSRLFSIFFQPNIFHFCFIFHLFLFFLSALYLSSFYRALISHMPIRSGSMMMKIEDEGKLDCCSSVDLKTVELEHAPNLLTFLYKFHFDNTSADKETNYVSTLLDQYRFV